MIGTTMSGNARWHSRMREADHEPFAGIAQRRRRAPARTWDAAIVGLGPAGLAALLGLVRRARRPLSLLLIDPAERPGGDAYRQARSEHLLNARAANMSVDPDDPDSFVRWLARRLLLTPGEAAARYAPRTLFAEYLDDMRALAFAIAGQGEHRLCRLRRTATDIDASERGWLLTLADGDRRFARHVILAPGCRSRRAEGSAARSGREATDPWRVDYAAVVRRFGDGTALIAGGGLSGVDAALSLATNGWTGPIVIATPRGVLPSAQQPHAPAKPGCRDLGLVSCGRASEVFASVRARLEADAREGRHWRTRIQQLRVELPKLWPRLGPAERRRLLRHAGSLWNRHRHCMAPEAAARIEELRRNGQLRVEPWRVLEVREERDALAVDVRTRCDGTRTVSAAYFIPAEGLDLTSRAHPLVAGMLDRGLVTASATGLGLAVEAVGTAVARRPAGASLHVVGSLLTGERLESTAVLEITAQARLAALELAALLGRPAESAGRHTEHAGDQRPEPHFACD